MNTLRNMWLSLALGLVLAGGTLFWPPGSPAEDLPRPAVAQGRLQGRFTAADTGKPVAGAKVRVLIEGVPFKDKRAEAVSGADGRYSLNVPLGHINIWGVHAPAGYYTQDPTTYGSVLTTSAEPKVTRDFVLQSGAAWRLEVQGVTAPVDKPPQFSAWPDPDANPNGYANSAEVILVTCDARGKAVLTVPSAVGRYRFSCNPMLSPKIYEIPDANLEMDKDFDPRKIKGIPEPVAEIRGAVRLRDAAGRSAVVVGVEVFVEAGQAVLRFSAQKVPAAEAVVLRGVALDETGKVVEGAKFTAAFFRGRGANMSRLEATTDAHGKFELRGVLLPLSWFQPDSRIQMMVVKSGFDGVETEQLNLLDVKQAGNGDFGTVVLRPGHTLRGKVVDENGQPVQGAAVTNQTNYFLYSHLACRTDAKGQFAMPDLPFRPHSMWVKYGDKYANQDVDFDAKSGEAVITLQPLPKPIPGRPGLPPAR